MSWILLEMGGLRKGAEPSADADREWSQEGLEARFLAPETGYAAVASPAQPSPAASTTVNDTRSPSRSTTISTSSPGSNSFRAAM